MLRYLRPANICAPKLYGLPRTRRPAWDCVHARAVFTDGWEIERQAVHIFSGSGRAAALPLPEKSTSWRVNALQTSRTIDKDYTASDSSAASAAGRCASRTRT